MLELESLLSAEDVTREMEQYRKRIKEGLTVIQRMGQPKDLGDMTIALATGQLAFCTGQVLSADGGLVIPRF